MKRKDFQQLAALRLKEARLLLTNHCWEGAYYLAAYAAECALKACIAKRTERHEFPDKKRVNDSYTHDMELLLVLAGLTDTLTQATKTHAELNTNWKIVRNSIAGIADRPATRRRNYWMHSATVGTVYFDG